MECFSPMCSITATLSSFALIMLDLLSARAQRSKKTLSKVSHSNEKYENPKSLRLSSSNFAACAMLKHRQVLLERKRRGLTDFVSSDYDYNNSLKVNHET